MFSSQGKIAQTRVLREAEHGTSGIKEIKSEHSLVQSIDGRKTIKITSSKKIIFLL